MQLLAQIATIENKLLPLDVDESILNASPGKILDAFTLHEILKSPCEEHVYYGPGSYIIFSSNNLFFITSL